MDRDQKGYVTAFDLQQLGDEVGTMCRKHDKSQHQQQRNIKISTTEANEMIETTNKIFADGTSRSRRRNSNEKNAQEHRLQPSVFEKMFEPSFH